MFVGRKNELKLLNDAYRSEKDELVVLYGRRRIGKNSLVKCFAKKKKPYICHLIINQTKVTDQTCGWGDFVD